MIYDENLISHFLVTWEATLKAATNPLLNCCTLAESLVSCFLGEVLVKYVSLFYHRVTRGRRCYNMAESAFAFARLEHEEKPCSSAELSGPVTQWWNQMLNKGEPAWLNYEARCLWHYILSSVNSVTPIALHGSPHWCVSATGARYHNRNLIQAFYRQEETHCIPSNNRHCLNIHVLLCN